MIYLCDKAFSNRCRLNTHNQIVHEKVRDHACDQCDYKTTSNMNLRIHTRRVHEGKPLKEQCQYCKLQTMSMDFHIKTYHGDKLL